MTQKREPSGQPVPCLRCRHFQITWEPSHPRSCKAMGFKTRDWPFLEVVRSSGESCLAFEEKPRLLDLQKVAPVESEPKDKDKEGPKRFSKIV
ncbi:MAG: hypothetical protein HQL84_10725 [Magnetococcales bacterium]|nr:hypothetical protein [Magnetococcales bacterium]MBF0150506.1 hypothetical protein [Magnetococcales bacterium]MBF0172964.1 hypothetical protein [Magnetococcales bacterium]MBF0631409.1 hypothetical protein [Magnetococcales bacterium]